MKKIDPKNIEKLEPCERKYNWTHTKPSAADVNTMGELSEWLAAHGLKMKPRAGRATNKLYVVELRKAGQPHVARPIVTGTGTDWESATRNAMFEFENKESTSATVA